MNLGDLAIAAANRKRRDVDRWEALDPDVCQMCGAEGNDKRSLNISCFYAIDEVIPEAINLDNLPEGTVARGGFYLRICKACRGRFLGHLRVWRTECLAMRPWAKDHDGNLREEDPERNIPVRIDGTVKMLTRDEWDDLQTHKPSSPDRL